LRLLLIVLLAGASPAGAAEGPEGRWLTQTRDGVIEIAACQQALCGRLVGLAEPQGPDGAPSAAASGTPMCNFPLLHVVPDGRGRWTGRITDPSNGSEWTCTLSVAGDGTLRLRGYILLPLIGQTQIWTRYGGRLGADCTMGGG
jgi:uncharacterized protein (DUF2147 family)